MIRAWLLISLVNLFSPDALICRTADKYQRNNGNQMTHRRETGLGLKQKMIVKNKQLRGRNEFLF
jgi:hypothetical protein